MRAHHFTVSVKDFGNPAKRSFARVAIKVTDHNDHAPDFMIQMFKSQIHETADVGTIVLLVKAIDRDWGRNSMIRYSVISGSYIIL